MISRRRWLQSLAAASAGALLGSDRSSAQQGVSGVQDTSNLFAMDQSAARAVRLPAKPGAMPSMTPDERDALEHRIHCQCGCTLDVFTCRTTDFACQVSPAMHRDMLALVEDGYGAQEILDAFVGTYGERALMAPTRKGFNVVGYALPGTLIAAGAVFLGVMLRRWRRPGPGAPQPVGLARTLDASPDELARLDAAIRDDS